MMLHNNIHYCANLSDIKKLVYYWQPLNSFRISVKDTYLSMDNGCFDMHSKWYGIHPHITFFPSDKQIHDKCLKISIVNSKIVYDGLPELSMDTKKEIVKFVSSLKNQFIHFWNNGDCDEFLDYDYLELYRNRIIHSSSKMLECNIEYNLQPLKSLLLNHLFDG